MPPVWLGWRHEPRPAVTTLSALFEELASAQTEAGIISLRRRSEPRLGKDVYEVKLGDEFLMSSAFTVAEVELARLGLGALDDGSLDVVVGGLGLGYTARAALDDRRVGSLVVIDALGEVIAWHERGLLPDTAVLTSDPRVRLAEADFFELASSAGGLDPGTPGRRFDAVLVDIDHSPRHVLRPSHRGLYTTEGLERLRGHLVPGGVFALWSDDPPDRDFGLALADVFAEVHSHVVTFPNFYTGEPSANTVYVARSDAQRP